jgi:predicted small integral membrane protein
LAAVVDVVGAMMQSKHLSLTAIGRALRGSTGRHGIKKVDRVLGNWRLHREVVVLYRCLARHLVNGRGRVVVLIDWTQIQGEFWALTASVPFLGRSIPILSRSYTETELGSRDAQAKFLDELREVLPAEVRPVIVADGGFRSPFFSACFFKGFYYVIRLRNDHSVVEFGWRGTREYERPTFDELFARATDKARCLGGGLPYASSQHAVSARIILGPRPRKAKKRRSYANDYERKRASEPYLLATNLENDSAEAIVRIYSARMQIEEMFRDTKSPRFGWGLDYSKTRSTRRFDVLLALASLAFATVALIGAAGRERGHEPKFRARSGANVIALSVFTLGTLILSATRRIVLHIRTIWRQLEKSRRIQRDFFPPITPPRSGGEDVPLPQSHGLFCVDCGWKGRAWGWPK